MLTVASLSQFDFYKTFELHAGRNGIARSISNVVIMEYESLLDDYSCFFEGDFVLTSLLFAVDHPERIYPAFKKLMQKGISGIAIKNIFNHNLDEALIKLADDNDIPLYTFHDIYMEDIIINVNEYHKSEQRYDYYEQQINQILGNAPIQAEITSLLAKLNPQFHNLFAIMYLEPIHLTDKSHTQRTLNKILYQKEKRSNSSNYFCMKYQKGYLFIYHFNEAVPPQQVERIFLDLLPILSIEREEMGISICSELQPMNRFQLLIRQCLYTNCIRKVRQLTYLTFQELGIHQMFAPLLMDPELRKGYEDKLQTLKDYDERHHSALVPTLIAYMDNHQQINNAARVLFQHPNTVRYRILKIQELLQFHSTLQLHMEGSIMIELLALSQSNS